MLGPIPLLHLPSTIVVYIVYNLFVLMFLVALTLIRIFPNKTMKGWRKNSIWTVFYSGIVFVF